MFKTNNETIIIDAKATAPINTGVVFWSHDRGTAKLIFQLQKDYMNQPLSAGTIVPILLEFNSDTAEGGRGRHIYHAVIEDAINGIVSIVLEDNILGYVGRVTGSIYIELPDSRSLDTAGRFTFDIKRSPIDLNTPELEDYYWQGFNEIIDEYHQTINTIKSEAKALIDSLTADVTEIKNDIAIANSRVDEISKKIDDNDVLTKAESSANVIYQIIGKENFEMALTMDFKEKVKGSVNENPNTLFGLGTTTLPRPSEMTTEVVQERYTAISEMDGNTVNSTITDNAYFPKFGSKWNLVEHVKKVLGEEYFLTLGAATLAQQVALLRTKITSLSGNSYGYGHSPSGYKISMGSWLRTTNTWESVVSHASDTISKLTIDIDKPLISNYIDDNGFFYTLVYSDPSDGKTATKVVTDYTNVVFTMEISANEHIKSMIAANHIENLATEEEAETGEDNKKIMTPLRVMQSIKKFVENKFVSIAGNETIGGLKNFRDGLMVKENTVLTHKGVVTIKYSNADFPTEIASGYITFVRYGDEIQVVFNFKTRTDKDFAKDQSIIWGIAADFQADTSEPQYIGIASTGGTTSLVKFTANGATLTAHSTLTKDTWYAGTVTYLAKNKL